jgi:hypothetical protein
MTTLEKVLRFLIYLFSFDPNKDTRRALRINTRWRNIIKESNPNQYILSSWGDASRKAIDVIFVVIIQISLTNAPACMDVILFF